MKTLLFIKIDRLIFKRMIVIIVFFPLLSFSQNNGALKINYNWAHIGDNIGVGYEKQIDKHSFSLSLLYHLNIQYTDNQSHAFKDRYYANNFIEHFGGAFEYQYQFNINNSDISPYIFYNLQLFKNRIRWNNNFSPYGIYEGNELYIKTDYFMSEPLFSIQNTFGVGLKFSVYKNIEVFAQAGVGITFLPLKDTKILVYKQREYSGFVNIGALYNFNR